MKLFVTPADVGEDRICVRDRGDIRHLTRVLRLRPGDAVDVSDGVRWEYRTRIETLTEDAVYLTICDKQAFAREPGVSVTLFQGVPKAGKMETVIQKCVELGVTAVTPVFMQRTVVERGNLDKKLARWQKISGEAAKQCRRGIVPAVEQPLDFADMLPQLATFDLVLFPYENEQDHTLKDCLRRLDQKPAHVAICIGPEGGFSDREAAALDEAGAVRVSLGRTILRTETAGMATLAMVMYELEL